MFSHAVTDDRVAVDRGFGLCQGLECWLFRPVLRRLLVAAEGLLWGDK